MSIASLKTGMAYTIFKKSNTNIPIIRSQVLLTPRIDGDRLPHDTLSNLELEIGVLGGLHTEMCTSSAYHSARLE